MAQECPSPLAFRGTLRGQRDRGVAAARLLLCLTREEAPGLSIGFFTVIPKLQTSIERLSLSAGHRARAGPSPLGDTAAQATSAPRPLPRAPAAAERGERAQGCRGARPGPTSGAAGRLEAASPSALRRAARQGGACRRPRRYAGFIGGFTRAACRAGAPLAALPSPHRTSPRAAPHPAPHSRRQLRGRGCPGGGAAAALRGPGKRLRARGPGGPREAPEGRACVRGRAARPRPAPQPRGYSGTVTRGGAGPCFPRAGLQARTQTLPGLSLV